jgi:hypothetical protein
MSLNAALFTAFKKLRNCTYIKIHVNGIRSDGEGQIVHSRVSISGMTPLD